jgi:ATP-dependent RNA helicase DDX41
VQAIEDPVELYQQQEGAVPGATPTGCAYCGGLGHRVQNCPKLHAESRQAQQRHRPEQGGRGMGGDM